VFGLSVCLFGWSVIFYFILFYLFVVVVVVGLFACFLACLVGGWFVSG